MSIQWTPNLSVGNETIDNEHKELFKRLNNLLDACNSGSGKDEIPRLLNFLGEYVVNHFSHEEKYMISNAYPKYPEHKQIHDDFIKKYTALKEEFENGGGALVIIRANRMLIDWLINHIGETDKELGVYLKKRDELF